MTGLLRKDGTPPALKKDGTPRIAGGGYDAEKQKKWCTGVLKRATTLVNSLFTKYEALAVLAQYATTDSGFDGVRHIFSSTLPKTITIPTLLKRFSSLSATNKNFKNKYKKFLICIEKKNIEIFLKNVKND